MATEVDAEIKRMNAEGKTSREISEELAKRNIFVTWQSVRGRIAFMARKGRPKEAPKRPKDEGKTPEIQSFQSKPESARTIQPTTNPAPKGISRGVLDIKIWDLYTKERKMPDEISEILRSEGYYYGKGSVRTRLRSQGADI
jgi:hypothetical protein